MTNPTKKQRQITAPQKQNVVKLCLAEELKCKADAQRFEEQNSSVIKCGRQALIDRVDIEANNQDQLTNIKSPEINRLGKENHEHKREKNFFKLAAVQYDSGKLLQGTSNNWHFTEFWWT